MQDVNKRRGFFLSLSKLGTFPKNSIPRKITYIWHFQQTGINATYRHSLKKREFVIKVTLSLSSPSSTLKLPITWTLLPRLYGINLIPLLLYDSVYDLTHWFASYRPWVAILLTLVTTPKSTCNHCFLFRYLAIQPPLVWPLFRAWSLAFHGP